MTPDFIMGFLSGACAGGAVVCTICYWVICRAERDERLTKSALKRAIYVALLASGREMADDIKTISWFSRNHAERQDDE